MNAKLHNSYISYTYVNHMCSTLSLLQVSPPPPVLERSTSPVFNYSIQSLNSTERAKERMRQRLSQDPYHRYTYSQQYHSMTVVPNNVAASEKAEKNKSRSKWLTREGFSCPIAPINCNSHPKKPDQTRCEDLQEVLCAYISMYIRRYVHRYVHRYVCT